MHENTQAHVAEPRILQLQDADNVSIIMGTNDFDTSPLEHVCVIYENNPCIAKI